MGRAAGAIEDDEVPVGEARCRVGGHGRDRATGRIGDRVGQRLAEPLPAARVDGHLAPGWWGPADERAGHEDPPGRAGRHHEPPRGAPGDPANVVRPAAARVTRARRRARPAACDRVSRARPAARSSPAAPAVAGGVVRPEGSGVAGHGAGAAGGQGARDEDRGRPFDHRGGETGASPEDVAPEDRAVAGVEIDLQRPKALGQRAARRHPGDPGEPQDGGRGVRRGGGERVVRRHPGEGEPGHANVAPARRRRTTRRAVPRRSTGHGPRRGGRPGAAPGPAPSGRARGPSRPARAGSAGRRPGRGSRRRAGPRPRSSRHSTARRRSAACRSTPSPSDAARRSARWRAPPAPSSAGPPSPRQPKRTAARSRPAASKRWSETRRSRASYSATSSYVRAAEPVDHPGGAAAGRRRQAEEHPGPAGSLDLGGRGGRRQGRLGDALLAGLERIRADGHGRGLGHGPGFGPSRVHPGGRPAEHGGHRGTGDDEAADDRPGQTSEPRAAGLAV